MSDFLYHFTVGHFSCVVIKDGDDWDRNVLLVNTGQHHVLIDTGNGDALSPPGLLLDRLTTAGIPPAAIDVVILSHGDIDHIAGLMDARGNIAFPHARHVLAREEWVFWSSHTQRTSPKHLEVMGEEWTQLAETFPRTRLVQLRDTLELIEAETEIVPGIYAMAAPGHTPGMIAIAVSSGNEQLYFIADMIYSDDVTYAGEELSEAIGNPEWHAVVDVDPIGAIMTRDQLFERVASEQTLLMAYHLPFPGLGHVVAHDRSWRWRPLRMLP